MKEEVIFSFGGEFEVHLKIQLGTTPCLAHISQVTCKIQAGQLISCSSYESWWYEEPSGGRVISDEVLEVLQVL